MFHAGVAVFLLEYVNYMQRYGLSLDITERIAPQHAWESQTHQSFWQLDTIEDAPTLATGYYGLFWPCLFTPLWKRWIDPRILTTP